ncbi:type II toxin-antitoxin system RelB/DinJ family antitoxin [Desulfonatronum thioautotrophicum]|uniref:type II toxin-antitoxin system RelB/DinJ family antitoxin n=1 Tax=Desulfonatronum thioautotrophicum TaxID=617001 RepID=UPI00069C0A81|nr:type II toxin-antitoxin system RelB/DinJ family antitoxin [Desulfonatronum thioautotrophicum]
METEAKIKVDQYNYQQAKKILQHIGLDYSQAINLFNEMIIFQKGLPFEYKYPNAETLKAMEEARNMDGDFISIDELSKAQYAFRAGDLSANRPSGNNNYAFGLCPKGASSRSPGLDSQRLAYPGSIERK